MSPPNESVLHLTAQRQRAPGEFPMEQAGVEQPAMIKVI